MEQITRFVKNYLEMNGVNPDVWNNLASEHILDLLREREDTKKEMENETQGNQDTVGQTEGPQDTVGQTGIEEEYMKICRSVVEYIGPHSQRMRSYILFKPHPLCTYYVNGKYIKTDIKIISCIFKCMIEREFSFFVKYETTPKRNTKQWYDCLFNICYYHPCPSTIPKHLSYKEKVIDSCDFIRCRFGTGCKCQQTCPFAYKEPRKMKTS
jgi:hypothetical protein